MYVLLLEQLERHVLAERQFAATLRAARMTQQDGSPIPIPMLHERRKEFDEALRADPKPPAVSLLSDEQRELRQALGVLT